MPEVLPSQAVAIIDSLFPEAAKPPGVFVIGPDRLGPKAMPAVNERQCDGALAGLERELWGVLLSGPYWDVKGDDLILKGAKGGKLTFRRSL